MIRAINLLRKTGDELERRAKNTDDGATRAQLTDIAMEWHFLAGQVDKLYQKAEEVEMV